MKMTYAEYINEIISYNGRYKKLKSVGTWLDLKTGYTFPINKGSKNGNPKGDKVLSDIYATVVHGFDCTDEWIEALSNEDTRDFGILMRLLRLKRDNNCYEWDGNDVRGFWVAHA